MASIISCSLQLTLCSRTINSCTSGPKLVSPFKGSLTMTKRLGWCRPTSQFGQSCGSRATCWFRFGKNGVDAEGAGIYGSQSRDDFDRDDVEQVNFIFMFILVVSFLKIIVVLLHSTSIIWGCLLWRVRMIKWKLF